MPFSLSALIERAPSARLPAVLAAVLCAALTLPSCDNPACALSGDCDGNSGGSSNVPENPATVPVDHLWVSPAAPTVTAMLPTGNTASTTTPIMIVFSESLAPTSLSLAFEIVEHNPDIPGLPAVLYTMQLVGDGRVVLLLPSLPLGAQKIYDVKFAADKKITDLQGTLVVQPSDRVIGQFEVIAANPVVPKVVGSYPADNAQNQSQTGEYVVVFDRPMDAQSITPLSWVVTVNGAPPADNPAPEPLQLVVAADTRVWRYRSVGVDDQPVPFPPAADVKLVLSPLGHPIKSLGQPGENLATTTLDYQVAPFTPPTSSDVVSLPADAFGISNFDGTAPLEIALGFSGVQDSDFLGIFVYGEAKNVNPAAITWFFREDKLGDIGFDEVNQTLSIGEDQLDLVNDAMSARLEEGEISIGFVVRRGQARTPIRMLDIDPVAPGAQGVVLDVTRPVFSAFGASGTNQTTLTSDMVDLTVVGKANEELRAVEVVAGTNNNGVVPHVVGSSVDGLFIAAPIDLDVIDPAQMPVSFTMDLYDRALNRSIASIPGTFLQVGAVGPGVGVPSPSTTIDVNVVDARTFAPIPNALVFVHEDLGATHDIVDLESTDANGNAVVEAGLVGESTITIDAPNYDLVSFCGIDVSRISVTLHTSNLSPGLLSGSALLSTGVATFPHQISDSRLLEQDEPFFDTDSCTPNQATDTTLCTFLAHPIRPGRIGGAGFVAFEDPTTAFNFVAATYLRAFSLDLPISAAGPAQATTAVFDNRTALSDASTPTEDRALAGPSAQLDITGLVGVTASGSPRVLVEGISPGIPGSVLAGRGIALDPTGTPATTWEVRSAIPGIADPTDGKYPGDLKGTLVIDGTIEDELYLRCEVRDLIPGQRTGVRKRFSVAPATLTPPSLPVVITPPPDSTTLGPSYDVVFSDVLPDGGDPGIYRVTLTHEDGRRWVLWRVDANGPMRSVHLADIGADGGTPLPAGEIAAEVSAYSYPSFDPDRFLFSELERRTEVLATAVTIFEQP